VGQTESAPPSPWNSLQRIGFRLAFVYLLLFALPVVLVYVPVVNLLVLGYLQGRGLVVNWVGRTILGVEFDLNQLSGSGDRTADYVLMFCHVVVAVAVALLWSLLDRRRTSSPKMHASLRVVLRYALALAMLGYGLAKVIPPTQFPSPEAGRLLQPYGESSPMGLLWTFMGASQTYTFFGGLLEVIAGLLLLFRRTTTLGCLVTAGVMLNVVMLNFCYDVPVKLLSSHLLLVALFLLLPDVPRFMNFFLLHRPTEPAPVRLPVTDKRWRIALLTVEGLFVAWLLLAVIGQQIYIRTTFGFDQPMPLAGVYEVESFRHNGTELPPLLDDGRRWRTLAVGGNHLAVRAMDDKRTQYQIKLNENDGTLELKPVDDPDQSITWRYEKLDEQLYIDGQFAGATVSVKLKKVERNRFLLVNRGFRWINEEPYNR
jgi:hypothetical protein